MMEMTSYDDALVIATKDDLTGRHVIITRAILAGEVIVRITGHREVTRADRFTVQVGANAHIDQLGPLTYLNHSCAPNVIFNTTELTLTAICDIAAGEELCFFYPSTEWCMAEPFDCLCGAATCVGVVAGAMALSDDTLSRFFVNRHIAELRRGS